MAIETVLVTGASGVVGGALLDALPGKRIFALSHSQDPAPKDGVTWLKADVREKRFGLGARQYDELTDSVDRVFHIAAMVDFDRSREEIRSVNVTGTRHVTEFCSDAGAGLVHTSTSFIARREQAFAVTGLGCSAGRDDYLRSKVDGEAIVRSSGVPYVIMRPSLLMGDAATGAINRHQGLHTFLGAYVKGNLPFLPFTEDTLVDFLPRDVVARAIATASDTRLDGTENWVTAGDQALTAAEICTIARQQALAVGRTVDVPRFFSVESVQRLIMPAFADVLDERTRRKFDNLLAMASLFSPGQFDTSLHNPQFATVEPTSGLLRSVIGRTIDRYWLNDAVSA